MASTRIEFTGDCEWAKVWPGQIDMGFADDSDKGGNWSIVVGLSKDDITTLKTLGVRQRIEEGNKVKFRRFERNKFGDLGAPKVEGVAEGESIGNGSNVTVTIEVYQYPHKGQVKNALRLEKVRVNKHVPYVREGAGAAPAAADEAPPVH